VDDENKNGNDNNVEERGENEDRMKIKCILI
jgi:hypothetical protein